MKKRLLSLIIVLVMLFTVAPAVFSADPSIKLSAPESVCIHDRFQKMFVHKDRNRNLIGEGKSELSKPLPITLTWTSTGLEGVTYTVKLGEDRELKDAKTYLSKEKKLDVYNLKLDTKYFWQVSAEKNGKTYQSALSSFVTEDAFPRNLNIDGVTNCRDLGNIPLGDGKVVKQGMLYRTAALTNFDPTDDDFEGYCVTITEKGMEDMKELGMKTEIELRYPKGGDIVGDSCCIDGVNYFLCPMEYGEGWEFEDNLISLRDVFHILSDENNYPAFFHCHIGTDRTGRVAFMVLALLGASEDDIWTDYMFSNFGYIGGNREGLRIHEYYEMVMKDENLSLADNTYNYLRDVIGVPAEELDSVRRILTSDKRARTATELFTDVKMNSWYETSVDYVCENGLMTGTGDGIFDPGAKMNRAMLVTVLYRIEGEPEVSSSASFTDLKQSWYKDSVAWANANGIVNGISADKFGPSDPVTREQMAAILYRYSTFKEYDVSVRADISSYGDAKSVSSYARDAMSWANGDGIITGTTDSSGKTVLAPKDNATRAQVATILTRYCGQHK